MAQPPTGIALGQCWRIVDRQGWIYEAMVNGIRKGLSGAIDSYALDGLTRVATEFPPRNADGTPGVYIGQTKIL